MPIIVFVHVSVFTNFLAFENVECVAEGTLRMSVAYLGGGGGSGGSGTPLRLKNEYN